MTADSRFEILPGVNIVVLDDEALVFNPFTWETHVLNAAATLMLKHLRDGGGTLTELQGLLEAALHDDDKANAANHAQHAIDSLVSLRLIGECATT